jgi:CDP-diglyceride synthetase
MPEGKARKIDRLGVSPRRPRPSRRGSIASRGSAVPRLALPGRAWQAAASPMSTVAACLSRVARLVYFMAPAYVANMTPPFVRYWRGWNRPISVRWLGSHKTVVGFAAGVLAAVVVTLVQSRIAWPGGLVAYDHWVALGLRFGVGAMAGDAAKSFVKRRLAIAPGKPWIPWDQVDFVLGALALVWGQAALSWPDVAIILVLSVTGHVLVSRVGYWTGIRDVKW